MVDFQPMVWPRGRASLGIDNVIRIHEPVVSYRPFDHYHPGGNRRSLYLEFASLNEGDSNAVLDFTTTYGLLGKAGRHRESRVLGNVIRSVVQESYRSAAQGISAGFLMGRSSTQLGQPDMDQMEWAITAFRLGNLPDAEWDYIWSHHMRRVMDTAIQLTLADQQVAREVYPQEHLSGFADEVRKMRRLIQLWVSSQADDARRLKDSIVSLIYERRRAIAPSEAEATRQFDANIGEAIAAVEGMGTERLRRSAGAILSTLVNAEVEGNAWPVLQLKERKAMTTWMARDLLTAMYVMFLLDVTGHSVAQQCHNAGCRKFFLPTRESQVYCCRECSSAERVRRYRNRKWDETKVT